jgi:hypothetical protein
MSGTKGAKRFCVLPLSRRPMAHRPVFWLGPTGRSRSITVGKFSTDADVNIVIGIPRSLIWPLPFCYRQKLSNRQDPCFGFKPRCCGSLRTTGEAISRPLRSGTSIHSGAQGWLASSTPTRGEGRRRQRILRIKLIGEELYITYCNKWFISVYLCVARLFGYAKA